MASFKNLFEASLYIRPVAEAWAWRRSPLPRKISRSPTVKQGINLRNFQILIVSAVEICKQCLQTASASGGLRPQTLYWGFAPGPHRPPGLLPQIKIPRAAFAYKTDTVYGSVYTLKHWSRPCKQRELKSSIFTHVTHYTDTSCNVPAAFGTAFNQRAIKLGDLLTHDGYVESGRAIPGGGYYKRAAAALK